MEFEELFADNNRRLARVKVQGGHLYESVVCIKMTWHVSTTFVPESGPDVEVLKAQLGEAQKQTKEALALLAAKERALEEAVNRGHGLSVHVNPLLEEPSPEEDGGEE